MNLNRHSVNQSTHHDVQIMLDTGPDQLQDHPQWSKRWAGVIVAKPELMLMCGPEACFFHLPKTSKLYKQLYPTSDQRENEVWLRHEREKRTHVGM
jgi:hypothetical protein